MRASLGCLVAVGTLLLFAAALPRDHRVDEAQITELGLHRLPIRFEPNVGQWDPDILFVARCNGYDVAFHQQSATFVEHQSKTSRVWRFVAASPATVEPEKPRQSYSNFFLGADPSRWKRRVPNYSQIRYHDAWPKIDIVFYDKDGLLEWDVEAREGANLDDVRWRFNGQLVKRSDVVVLPLHVGELRHGPPRTSENRAVAYVHHIDGSFGFLVEGDAPVVIDPVVDYVTYVPVDTTAMLAPALDGGVFVGGIAVNDFSSTTGSYQETLGGLNDVGVLRLNTPLTDVVFASYLGGTEDDFVYSAASTSSGTAAGDVYLYGFTESANFPRTLGPTHRGDTVGQPAYDLWVARMVPSGDDLSYSRLLGGTGPDYARVITVTPDGDAYIVAFSGSPDVFLSNDFDNTTELFELLVAGFNPAGVERFVSYFGGGGQEDVYGIDVDANGNLVIAGSTTSTDFPTSSTALATDGPGGFLTIIDPLAPAILRSTRIPFGTPFGMSVADDGIWVAVSTSDSTLFVSPNGLQGYSGLLDVYIARIDSQLETVAYGSYLGGSENDSPFAMLWTPDVLGVVGSTVSALDFPQTDPPVGPLPTVGDQRLFVSWLHPDLGLVRRSVLVGPYLGAFTTSFASRGGQFLVSGGTDSSGQLPISEDAVFGPGLSSTGFMLRGSVPAPIPELAMSSDAEEFLQASTVPLTLSLSNPVDENLFIALSSTDPSVATVSPQSLVIQAGDSLATLDLRLLQPGSATISSQLPEKVGGQEATLPVTVLEGPHPATSGCSCDMSTSSRTRTPAVWALLAVAAFCTRWWGRRSP